MDFSEASLHALRFARSLAAEADAGLTLLHVIDLSPELEAWMAGSEQGRVQLEEWRRVALGRLRDLLTDEDRARGHVDERVETGRVHRQVLRVAAERGAGLIVVGAHGRGVVERMFAGSTAQHVAREATCPVLVFRQPRPTFTGEGWPLSIVGSPRSAAGVPGGGVDRLRFRRAALAQEDGEGDHRRQRQELALPVLQRLEPELR